MTENYVQKILGQKCTYLGLVSILGRVLVFRVLFFCSEHFLTILVGNNNKMTENHVHMVWVQKQVVLC